MGHGGKIHPHNQTDMVKLARPERSSRISSISYK